MSRQLQNTTLKVEWAGLRRDIPEGRRWKVISQGRAYLVSFWQYAGLRFGMCQCPHAAFNVGREGAKPCRHILAAAKPDSILTQTPMRGH